MHRFFVLFALAAAGCVTASSPSDHSSSGVSSPLAKTSTVSGEGGSKLTLTKPSDQRVRRGETREIDIRIAKVNLAAAVAIHFEGLPAGVTVAERDRKIQPDEHVVTYTLITAANAGLVGGHVVHVKAVAPDGAAVSETFTIDVTE